MTQNTTSTATLASTGLTPTPPTANQNPSNLDTRHLAYFGLGSMISASLAWEHFHGTRNPFIAGSPQHTEYEAIRQEQNEREKVRYLKVPEFPIEVRPSKRRLGMPRLKMKYDTLHDIRLRLLNSCIFIGSRLVYITDIREIDGDYLLLIQDYDGKQYRCWYNQCDAIDLRTPEPQYIVAEDRAPAYLLRLPVRSQRQGLCHENAYAKWVGQQDQTFRLSQFGWMMKGLSADPLMWSDTLYDLMAKAEAFKALRLSKDVAFYREANTIHAEYRGRYLGEVNDNSVKVDDVDIRKPWVGRDVRLIGCTLRN